jgi:hypothetical protein
MNKLLSLQNGSEQMGEYFSWQNEFWQNLL